MLTRRHMLAIFAISSLQSARAQDAKAELDQLFAQLRDPASGSAVLRIEPQIWSIWMQGGTSPQNEALASASAAMNIGEFVQAEEKLDALLAETPSFSEAWNKRATLYFLMGRYEESLADIVKTLELEPRHFGALSGRGMIYQRLGRNAEALTAYKQALAIHPKLTGARVAVKQLEKLLPEL